MSLVAFWALFGKYALLRGELEDTRASHESGLAGAAGHVARDSYVAPDRAPGINRRASS